MDEILGNESVVNSLAEILNYAIVAILGWVSLLVSRYIKDNHKREAIGKAIEIGVWRTYEKFVKEAKAASTDGKLTKEERSRAFSMAMDTAKREAQKNGIDLLKEIGFESATQLIENTVQRFKNGAK